MTLKRWRINKADQANVDALFGELKIHKVLCNILVQRGIQNYQDAKRFFRPQLSDLHDPFLMKDMEKAVGRILNAFNSNEKILVFGDYDVDGTTAVASMYQFLKQQYDLTEFYIPHRYKQST